MRQKVAILDIDGCLVNSSARCKYIVTDKGNEAFIESIQEYRKRWYLDEPLQSGIDFAYNLLNEYKPDRIICLTARRICEEATTKELFEKHINIKPDEFIFNDNTYPVISSVPYKQKQVKLLKEKYDIVFAIDDSKSICDMYKEEGLNTYLFCDESALCHS